MRTKEEIAIYTREWKKNNRDKCLAYAHKGNLKHFWGITPEDYDVMLTNQNSRCLICNTDTPGGRGRFPIDHCHDTGKIRGLLCNQCNLGLGHFKDDPVLLARAIEHILEHRNEKS